MKVAIAILALVIVGLLIVIFLAFGWTKAVVCDRDLIIDTQGRQNGQVGYIQISAPDDLASFRMLSDDGTELNVQEVANVVRTYNKAIGLNYAAGFSRESGPTSARCSRPI
jgi:hypothetical protein